MSRLQKKLILSSRSLGNLLKAEEDQGVWLQEQMQLLIIPPEVMPFLHQGEAFTFSISWCCLCSEHRNRSRFRFQDFVQVLDKDSWFSFILKCKKIYIFQIFFFVCFPGYLEPKLNSRVAGQLFSTIRIFCLGLQPFFPPCLNMGGVERCAPPTLCDSSTLPQCRLLLRILQVSSSNIATYRIRVMI